jgi:hypothetical protein
MRDRFALFQRAISRRRRLQCLLAALGAAWLLMLPAALPADAGSPSFKGSFNTGHSRPNIGRGLNSGIRHGKFGPHRLRNRHDRSVIDKRFDKSRFRPGTFEPLGFGKRHKRSRFARRFDHRFGRGFLPTYGSRNRRYYEDEELENYDDPGRGAEDRSGTGSEAQPQPSPPVTPKWIRVEVQVPAEGSASGGASVAQSGVDENCRDGTTQITVDGKPVEAYREDCRRAN